MSGYDEALSHVRDFADERGTDSHARFFYAFSPRHSLFTSDYWRGMADAYTDVIEHCEELKEERDDSVAGTARRVFRSARVRLGF